MISPLSLSNVATVIFAAICLWTIAAQARGNVVKLWRLAVPPSFAAVQAFVLLAGVLMQRLPTMPSGLPRPSSVACWVA